LRNEVDLLTKELQTKDSTIKKLDIIIEKLQDDASLRRQALDAQVRILNWIGVALRLQRSQDSSPL